ncbi:tetratricopeptide repeat protein [Streptomyces sp. NPDC002619]|uniref:tetratricopeptide repeat protein n=1 Tax=Streptomyces sp. NPDC002619 TaxID=3364655 RepID=UPI0036C28282
MGRHQEAREGFEEVYAARRRILGDRHPYTLLTRTELALLAWERNDLDCAEGELSEIYNQRRQVLGDSHPQTRWTLAAARQLAELRSSAGVWAAGDYLIPEAPSF